MIAKYHGLHLDIASTRKRFSTSLRGTNLAQLIRYAHTLNFSSRPVRLEMQEIINLKTPCILHWDLNHFVVLEKADSRKLTILDPAYGRKVVTISDASIHFTGIALELLPNAEFQIEPPKKNIRLRSLSRNITGLKRSLTNIFAIALTIEIISLLVPQATQWIVDHALVSADYDLLLVAVLGGCILIVTSFTLRLAQGWIGIRLNQQLSIQLTGSLFSHLISLPWSYFEKRQLGDICTRFQSLSSIRSILTNGALTGALDGLVTSVTLAMMFVYSTTLTLLSLTALALYFLSRTLFYAPLRTASEERLVLSARENSYFLETLRTILPIKLFNGTMLRHSTWQNLFVDVQNRDVTTQKLLLAFSGLNTLIFGLEGMLILYIGGQSVLQGSLTLGMLLTFIAYKGQFTGRASKLIDLSIEIRMISLHTDRIADIIQEVPEHDETNQHDISELESSIEFKNISFRYSNNESWIIRNFSLSVPSGESIAIIGVSGCGKTTLLKLLLGLLTPTEGEILVGGIPIIHLGFTNYRNTVSSIMQDDQLLAGSLAENISCFEPTPCEEKIKNSAKLAGIDAIIKNMPMGYQTLVPELGTGLSGGEKQKILLARALYRETKILVMDEATSHLDVRSEQYIIKSLEKMQITRVFIAHRPETLALAKRVIRLENGQLSADTYNKGNM